MGLYPLVCKGVGVCIPLHGKGAYAYTKERRESSLCQARLRCPLGRRIVRFLPCVFEGLGVSQASHQSFDLIVDPLGDTPRFDGKLLNIIDPEIGWRNADLSNHVLCCSQSGNVVR